MSNNPKKEISLYDKWIEQMQIIQNKTGINGNYVIGILLFSIICVSLGYLDRFITNMVGILYPAFWTIKSIETKGEDDKHWLTYWVVFASFTIIDLFSGFILKFIPFYFFFKIIFLIWLFMPNSKGCDIVYHLLVVRVFKSFEQNIDQATDKLTENFKDIVNIGSDMIDQHTEKIISNVISGVFSMNSPKKSNNKSTK